MFEHLAEFSKILVTGPQRSGTTICARMISSDLGYEFVDEHQVGIGALEPALDYWKTHTNFVMQGPGLCAWVEKFTDGAVVLVRRDLNDIKRSEARIGWNFHEVEAEKYSVTYEDLDPWLEINSAKLKYEKWKEQEVEHPFEVNYLDLRKHELWVEDREGFDAKQIEVGNGPIWQAAKVYYGREISDEYFKEEYATPGSAVRATVVSNRCGKKSFRRFRGRTRS